MHRKTRSNVAYCSLSINTGTRDESGEPSKSSGIAHITEHMLFRGTEKFSSFEISKRLESRGGDINAFTGKEDTVVHTLCLKEDFKRSLELIQQMVFHSKFNPKDIASEKEIIFDEINSYKDSPSELIYDDFEELLFNGSSLGRNILGAKKYLTKVSQSDLLKYTQENFITSEIVISASGNISHDRFKTLCEAVFGSIPKTERNQNRVESQKVETFDISVNKKTYQTHSFIGGYAPDVRSPKRIQMSLLCNLLAGPFSMSLLNQSLREKKSITYNVESSYTPYSDNGYFGIYFSCENAKLNQAKELISKELNDLKNNKLSDIRFNRFKRQFLGQLIIANENQESMMLAIAKSILVFNEFESQDAIYKKIDTLTASEIQDMANEVFNDNNTYSLTYQ